MRKFILPLLLLHACSPTAPTGGLHEDQSDLKVGVPSPVHTLAKHAADTFKLSLDSGMLVYGNIDQQNFDAIVEFYNPKRERVASFDSYSRGAELFRLRTFVPGIHRLVVTPYKEGAGEYAVVVTAAEPVATTAEEAAQQFMRSVMGTNSKAPGAAVAVMKDGKIVFSKGYGYADLESDRPITPSTIFHVASVSKQFTAFAIAMLADQGKLSLDDDIRKYLPELHDFGHTITINHLAHHTSGLRDQWNLLMMAGWRLDDVITQKQIMRMIVRQRELNFKPGEEFLYCNTGFTLMAEIVQRVTGQTLAQWTAANIFGPLEMKNTFFYDDHEKMVANRAYSYYRNGDANTTEYKKSVLSYATAGATSLFTTPEDLCAWAQNFETKKVGNAKVMAMMQQPFILNKGDTTDYAMGIAIGKYRGLRTINHSGGDAGFRSFLVRFPDENVNIAVASNYAAFGPAGLAYAEAGVFLGDKLEPEKPWSMPPPPTKKDTFDVKSVRLAEYEGSYYSDELDTRYWFDVQNDTLRSHHQRHDEAKLFITGKDSFDMENLGDVVFTRDKSGKVDGFKASNGRVRNLLFRRH